MHLVATRQRGIRVTVLISSIGACVSQMTGGERRLAERLEQELNADYLLWYYVPVGPKHLHPDFVVMHPRRGILVLEVKDWKLGTIQQVDKNDWVIAPDGIPKTCPTHWSKPGNTHTRSSTRLSAMRNWGKPIGATKASWPSPGAMAWC